VLAEVAFEGRAIVDVRAVGVLKIGQFADQCLFERLFGHDCLLSGVSVFWPPAERL